jgi:uncharacterized repeat protein (TIGR03803 family)
VIRDSAGNLYGTTYSGGSVNVGAVYKLDTTGHETVLYSFTFGADGYHTYGGGLNVSILIKTFKKSTHPEHYHA